MKYQLVTSANALSDIEKSVEYYDDQQMGLGKRFASVIQDTLAKIKKMPLAASIVFEDTRYKVVTKFPYVILYRVQGNIIFIARVFNTYQQPAY